MWLCLALKSRLAVAVLIPITLSPECPMFGPLGALEHFFDILDLIPLKSMVVAVGYMGGIC